MTAYAHTEGSRVSWLCRSALSPLNFPQATNMQNRKWQLVVGCASRVSRDRTAVNSKRAMNADGIVNRVPHGHAVRRAPGEP